MKTLLCLLIFSCQLPAQSFSFSNKTFVNGIEGEMKGGPGDIFTSAITFSNSNSNPAYVVMNRYKNDHPPYWAICYCYFECHSPKEDSILVVIPAFSTAEVILLFKTDSVNPGIAYNSFDIYELGFKHISQNMNMTASTISEVGIREQNRELSFLIGPNPASAFLAINTSETGGTIRIYDILGNLKAEQSPAASITDIDISALQNGVYLIELKKGPHTFTRRFIKE